MGIVCFVVDIFSNVNVVSLLLIEIRACGAIIECFFEAVEDGVKTAARYGAAVVALTTFPDSGGIITSCMVLTLRTRCSLVCCKKLTVVYTDVSCLLINIFSYN